MVPVSPQDHLEVIQVPLFIKKSSPQCKSVVLLFGTKLMAEMLSSSSEWECLKSELKTFSLHYTLSTHCMKHL